MLRIVMTGAASAAMLAGAVQPSGQELRAQASAENAIVGTLSGYNVKTRVLTVKVDKDLQRFVLAEKASVHLGSQVLQASDIPAQTGHKVKVRFVESGGKRLAETVMVSRAP
jgi:uncharacterized membrane protein